MKGSAITGPVGKEAAELWPVCYAPPFYTHQSNMFQAYCQQLGRCYVKGCFFRGSGTEMGLLLHASEDGSDHKIMTLSS